MVDMPSYRLATYTGLKMRKIREIGKIILDLEAMAVIRSLYAIL